MHRPIFNLLRYLSPDSGESGGAIIDPDNTFFDENGNPAPAPGAEEEPEKKDKPAPEGDPDNSGDKPDAKKQEAPETDKQPAGKDEPAGNAGKDKPAEDQPKLSLAERMLKANGYELDEIEVEGAEGPVKKKLNELSPDEQLSLLNGEFDALEKRYQEQITSLSGEGAFKTEAEKQIIEFLRTNGDPKALADFILQQDPAARLQTMDNESLVKDGLKKLGWSEEDIAEEIEALKESERLEKYAERFKKNVDPNAQPDYKQLLGKQTEFYTKQLQQQHEQESKTVEEFLKAQQAIADFPLNDEVRKYLKETIVPESHDKDSAFLEKIGTPEGLAKAAFLVEFFDDIKANYESQIKSAYEQGKAEAEEIKRKFRDEPITNSGGGSMRRIKASEGQTFNQQKKSEPEF